MVIFYDDMTWHRFHLWIGVDGKGQLQFIKRERDDDPDFQLEERPATYIRATDKVQPVVSQLVEYFNQDRHSFEMTYDMSIGTSFQQRVWAKLREIPYGETVSYHTIAKALGKPQGAQAIGQAISHNPFMIATPCHRVIGKNGHLTGFTAGLDMKQALLDLETGLTSFNLV